MKKKMRDENLMKISELADRCITDTAIAGILLCFLLSELKKPVESEMLYDICVTGGMINFFTYQETVVSLLENGSICAERNENREECYSVTDSGREMAKKLHRIAAKSYRDDILALAQIAIQRKRNEKDAHITCEPLERGCHLHVVLKDRDMTLLDLRLFTPDTETARQLGDRILANPSVLYHDVLQAVLTGHEPPQES